MVYFLFEFSHSFVPHPLEQPRSVSWVTIYDKEYSFSLVSFCSFSNPIFLCVLFSIHCIVKCVIPYSTYLKACDLVSRARGSHWRRSPWGRCPAATRSASKPRRPRRGRGWVMGNWAPSQWTVCKWNINGLVSMQLVVTYITQEMTDSDFCNSGINFKLSFNPISAHFFSTCFFILYERRQVDKLNFME